MRKHPRFDAKERFEFRPVRELDMTNDRQLFDRDLRTPNGDIPVVTGGSFELWDPAFGPPYAYGYFDTISTHLESKLANQRNNRRSAFYGLPDEALIPRPWQRARIAFRDVARSTDSRTMIACLVPPRVALANAAPYLLNVSNRPIDEAFLLGVLSSIPFDWYARRFVELHMNFAVLLPMPIPRPRDDDPLRLRVIEVAGRLAAIDERYADWARAVGVGVGTVSDQSEKDDLIAELDALAALLYGLGEAQLRHVFETFHIGWNYEPRLNAVLVHYHTWSKEQA
jgi:hypothetical protein